MAVHSILPSPLTAVVDEVLGAAGIEHASHGDEDPIDAATSAASDPQAKAVIGPFRSRDVAEVLEITAPRRLALLAPAATWVGVTRDDEPGAEDDPARHDGTVFRMVARDTVVAERIARRVRDAGQLAIVVAGGSDYGEQLERQLTRAGLPRTTDRRAAGLVVLAAVAGQEETAIARSLAPLPIIAFDGAQGEHFPDQRVEIASVYAADDGPLGSVETRRAAHLLVDAIALGGDVIDRVRELGPFDDHGDLIDPMVRFERYG